MKAIPARSQARGKAGFSDRKPYPGWMASTPFSLRQRDDSVHVQIRFYRPFALADQVGFIGLETVQGQAVFLRIDGHRAQAQFIGGAQDADGNFAAVQC